MGAPLTSKNEAGSSNHSAMGILDLTPLGGESPIRALQREGVTLPGLRRALRITPNSRAILIESSVPTEWLDTILESGSEVWLTLRRPPSDELTQWMMANRERVRVMIGFVPQATSTQELLEVLDSLKENGLSLQVSIEGLIPGITDTRGVLGELLTAISARGFRQVTISYLALDSRVEAWLHRTRPDEAAQILWQYREGPQAQWPGRGAVRLLPRTRRQRGYAALLSLAAEHEMTVCISPLGNPDFSPPRTRMARQNHPRLSEVYLAGGPPLRFESLP